MILSMLIGLLYLTMGVLKLGFIVSFISTVCGGVMCAVLCCAVLCCAVRW